ncbi:amine oxidase catalytic domain-containing protein [Clavulina sp. PMI_390]|nr:amine oxidase catalytic domain-containing protein [Clavulina sp. PMI_390]
MSRSTRTPRAGQYTLLSSESDSSVTSLGPDVTHVENELSDKSVITQDYIDSHETIQTYPTRPTAKSRLTWALKTTAIIFIGIGAVTLAVSSYPNTHRDTHDISPTTSLEDNSASKPPQCTRLEPVAPIAGASGRLENVWIPLSVAEAVAVRKWVMDDARGLNLTEGTKASMSDSYIELVETIRPNKASALAYYAGTGPKPERAARVVIDFGGEKHPYTKNFVVGPLPISAQTTIKPLEDIYHRPVIPHNARTMQPNDSLFKVLPSLGKGLERLTEAIFGGVAAGMPNDTLVISGSGPFSFDGSFRRIWLQWKHNFPGDFLNPLNLHSYVEVSGTDPSLWKTLKVVYNRQIFNSTAELLEAFDNKTLKIEKYPPIDPNWAARYRTRDRSTRRDLDWLAGPRSVPFDGLRFRVDVERQFVTWMGWEFYLGFDRDMGMSLWNIKFLGDRIIYELAPQEALAQYSGDDPHQATTAWLDRYFGMGACVYEMIPGYDCPHGAVYLPSTIHGSVGSMMNPRAICIFERDNERPLTRHRGRKPGETGAVKDYQLVVRSVATVGKYFDYTFMLDGSLETRVSASGYLQGGYWEPTQDQHGTRIHRRSMGTLHDHVINFKVDFDIISQNNSLLAKSTVVRDVPHPWLDEDWGPSTRQQFISSRYIDSEDESRLYYPPNFQGAYAIVNKDETNSWGMPRGYGIIAGHSPIYNTVVGSKRMLNNANWAKHNLAVTKRKENEPSSSSAWNHHLPGAPPVDFERFFDGESLDQEDIVAWINIGMHHIPQAEDSPNTRTNTASSSFILSPLNFHDYDVSMDSSNAVLMDQDPKTKQWSFDEYDVKAEYCAPPELPPLDYGNDMIFDLDGNPVDKDAPEREPWLRENQFPHATDNWNKF